MTAMLRFNRSSNAYLTAWPAAVTVVGLAMGLAACPSSDTGVPDEALGGLVIAPENQPREIDMERLRQHPDELIRAAQLTHVQVGARLGSHRFAGSVKIEVKEGDAIVESLAVQTHIDLAADGGYRAISENSRDYGREVIFKDGSLYLAPRYSRFHKRAPENASEPAAIRSEMFSELAAHLELLQRGIDVEDRGTGPLSQPAGQPDAQSDAQSDAQAEGQPDTQADTQAAARTVRTIGIVKAPADRPVTAPEQMSQRKWRDTIAIAEASGEIAVDVQTGVVLHAEVRGGVTFERDGRRFTMTFDVAHDIADIGTDIAIAAPPDDRWVATPLRRKEVEMRDRLLKGIAPPTRKFDPKPAANGEKARGGTGAGKKTRQGGKK